MPNLEKFPTSASHAIRTSTPNQHAQRENRRRAVCREMLRRGKPPKSGCRKRLRRGKTAEKRFNMFTGLARLPRDTSGTRNYRRSAVVERCCVEENRRRAVSYVSTGLARLPRDANASPIYRRRAVVENTPEGGIVRHRTLRSVFLNEAASPQPILAYLSNIVLPTYHQ